MRPSNLLVGLGLAIGFLAAAASATPIRVTLQSEEPGGRSPLTFTYDMDRQPLSPYDYPDIGEFSGDYVRKEEEYRINVADYYFAEMAGFTGYGYNWLLERYPRAFGIYEEYGEVRFEAPDRSLSLWSVWSDYWELGTPISVAEYAGADIRHETMRIVGMEDLEAVPEPSTWALFATGLAFLAGAGLRRRSARRRTPGA